MGKNGKLSDFMPNKTKKKEMMRSDFMPNKTKKIRNEVKRRFYALQPIMNEKRDNR